MSGQAVARCPSAGAVLRLALPLPAGASRARVCARGGVLCLNPAGASVRHGRRGRACDNRHAAPQVTWHARSSGCSRWQRGCAATGSGAWPCAATPRACALAGCCAAPHTRALRSLRRAAEFEGYLSGHCLFAYCGHGSGGQFLAQQVRVAARRSPVPASRMPPTPPPPQAASALRHCSAALLMGCSSGRLVEEGEFEPTGMPLAYAHAGAATVRGGACCRCLRCGRRGSRSNPHRVRLGRWWRTCGT